MNPPPNPPPIALRRFRARLLACRRPVLAALGALVVAFGLSSCGKPSTPQAAASDFFLSVSVGHLAEAYASASFAFQAQISPESFQATAKDLGLVSGNIICRWYGEEIKGRDARLTGDLVSGGKSVPVVLRLVLEQGRWRVFSIVSPAHNGQEETRFTLVGKGGAFIPAVNHKAPPEAHCRQLVRTALMDFNQAIRTGSFAEFYASVSKLWRQQLSEAQLQRTFQGFVDAKVDFSGLRQIEPVFDAPPAVNSEGVLVLSGHYETRPYRLYFTLRFVYDLPYWKLYGLDVRLQADKK